MIDEGDEMDGVVYPDVTTYVEAFGGIEALSSLEDYARDHYVPIVMKDAASFLRFMVMTKKPKKILELGTAIGYSALIMALSSQADIISIERDPKMIGIARENIKTFGMEDKIQVVQEECQGYLDQTEEKFDFIFIDAGKSHYQDYVNTALPLLHEDGIILCDNVLYKGKVVKETVERKHRTNVVNLKAFLEDIFHREDLTASLLTVSDGMLLIRRNIK